jgi:prevent-host-death family protein
MQDTEAGVRQLKTNLSTYLSRVKAGQTVLITERGKPIGRIVPIAESVEERLERLSQAGLVAWNGHTLAPLAPPSRARGPYTVADLLLEDRE